MRFIVTDSITRLPDDARDAVVLAASHGGSYSAVCALKAGLRAVVLCDAGVGREQAGIAGLQILDEYGIPAAAISHRTARIGDGADCHARGVISFSNAGARRLGVEAGDGADQAVLRLAAAAPNHALSGSAATEQRYQLRGFGQAKVVVLDSASLIAEEDRGGIVVTGSHGGLLGGDPASAVKYAVFAAVFNDADRGVDDGGISRLRALDERHIAAATVSAWSARIGDGRSSYHDGFVSAVNRRASALGAEVGLSAAQLVARFAAAYVSEQRKQGK
jgi:hypothetical protein